MRDTFHGIVWYYVLEIQLMTSLRSLAIVASLTEELAAQSYQ